jgi:hypothetical protein
MFKLLNRPQVLWFLFLFNAAVAIAVATVGGHIHVAGLDINGARQVTTAVGMGVVALGAGVGLLRLRVRQS